MVNKFYNVKHEPVHTHFNRKMYIIIEMIFLFKPFLHPLFKVIVAD